MRTIHSQRVGWLAAYYAACFAATWTLLGLESRLSLWELAAAFTLQVLVGVLLVRLGGFKTPRRFVAVAMVAFLVSVALLRDGVGTTPEYGSLVLLPVIWASLRCRRGELAWAIAGTAAVVFLPIVTIGGTHYPTSGWRLGGLLVVIAGVVGMTVLVLVERLRTSEERHRLLAENSTDLVVRFGLDGTTTYASLASRALLGYDPDDLLGENIFELVHPEGRDKLEDRAPCVGPAPEATVLEARIRHRDGRWLWFEANVRAIRGPGGEITERQGAIRLIEDRKRLQLTVEHQRDQANEMLAAQHALREIATLVATGAPPGAVFHAVAEQIAQLLGGARGGVVRFDGPSGVGEIVGAWSADGEDSAGREIDLAGASAAAKVYQCGAPVQTGAYVPGTDESFLEQFAPGGAVCAPILVGARLWGSAGASFAADTTIPDDAEDRLASIAELVAVAIANADAWETLARRAATDSMTGLANYRIFHERLDSEIERATRHGRAVSLAIFDLDHFKAINDTHGHQIGDAVLAAVARRLAAVARTGELVARIGGEEFAWLMPETRLDGAYLAAERARRAIEAAPFEGVGTLTISAGVCSNEHAHTAQELLSAADQALYRAKRNGRNMTSRYAQDVSASLA